MCCSSRHSATRSSQHPSVPVAFGIHGPSGGRWTGAQKARGRTSRRRGGATTTGVPAAVAAPAGAKHARHCYGFSRCSSRIWSADMASAMRLMTSLWCVVWTARNVESNWRFGTWATLVRGYLGSVWSLSALKMTLRDVVRDDSSRLFVHLLTFLRLRIALSFLVLPTFLVAFCLLEYIQVFVWLYAPF